MKRLTCVFTALLITASLSEARTWRVNTMGTGDAPDLYAAMDSVISGDSVLVAAGEYLLPFGLSVHTTVRLVGESGAGYTVLSLQGAPTYQSVGLLAGAKISGFHIRGNPSTSITLYLHEGAMADHCVIETPNNATVLGGVGGHSLLYCLFVGGEIREVSNFFRCIILSDLGSEASGSQATECDILGDVAAGIDITSNFNISLDPQFCGIPGSGNYFLQSTSPCLPGNPPYLFPFQIGPLGVGCGSVKVETTTWGGVKALYR